MKNLAMEAKNASFEKFQKKSSLNGAGVFCCKRGNFCGNCANFEVSESKSNFNSHGDTLAVGSCAEMSRRGISSDIKLTILGEKVNISGPGVSIFEKGLSCNFFCRP